MAPWGALGLVVFCGRRAPVVYPRYRLVFVPPGAVADGGFGSALASIQVLRKRNWGFCMNVDEEAVRQLAQMIWETEGKPDGQQARHWEMATRLAESAAMAPTRTAHRPKKAETLFPVPDEGNKDDN